MERFPSQIEDEFDEIEELKEEYSNAPLFQRIHTSGDDTSGVCSIMQRFLLTLKKGGPYDPLGFDLGGHFQIFGGP